jgi:hypothetical protein
MGQPILSSRFTRCSAMPPIRFVTGVLSTEG